jgi:primosomal protein N' (replication factor Y)
MTIARVALPVGVDRLFDYWIPGGLAVVEGAVVRVRLGRRRLAGVVHEIADHSEVTREGLQSVEEIAEACVLAADVRELVEFVAAYYQAPLGLAYALAMPPLVQARARSGDDAACWRLTDAGREALRDALGRAAAQRAVFTRLLEGPLAPDEVRALAPTMRRVLTRWREAGWLERDPGREAGTPPRLNDAQRACVDVIAAARGTFAPLLLQGVTGSGKTEVYLAAAAATVAAGGQVLMLVPEINLTPQLRARVAQALPRARTVTLHSALAEGARRAHWDAAACGEADVVLGTRLAVFTPLPRLALVVVDEEHDASFKQHDGVRYHARDAAVWRARARAVPIVLGSATPSLESHAHALAGRYRRLVLDRRADPRAAFPAVRLVAARGPAVRDGVSQALRDAIGASSRWCSSTDAASRRRSSVLRAAGRPGAHAAPRAWSRTARHR